LLPEDHPSRHASCVDLGSLAAEPLLTAPAGYFSRLRLEATAQAAGIDLTIGAQSSSPLALMVLGKSGVGIPILPDDYPLVGQHSSPYPVVLDEHGLEISVPVWLHWRNDAEALPTVGAFIAEAREQVALEAHQGRMVQTYYGLHESARME
jgi:DNA-binding transcriptional LysR family regulator